MEDTTKRDALRRLAYIEGHLRGVRRMVEADTYCVDVLHQTHAIQKALEGFEQLLLQGHLRTCVPSGIRAGREQAVLTELADLYGVARRWRAADASAADSTAEQGSSADQEIADQATADEAAADGAAVAAMRSAASGVATAAAGETAKPRAGTTLSPPPTRLESPMAAAPPTNPTTLVLPISGMTCASCVRRVERALGKVPGVAGAQVNLATERATVELDPAAPATLDALRTAVQGAGYGVGLETVVLPISGMTCASCVRRVERALAKVPGVRAPREPGHRARHGRHRPRDGDAGDAASRRRGPPATA